MTATESAARRFPLWLRLLGYALWFTLCFGGFLYLSLSSSLGALRQPVAAALEDALGKGQQGRYGTDPQVTIGDLSLWRLTGVQLERVTLQLASSDPDPGPVIELDSLGLRLGIGSTLLGEPRVEWQAALYRGQAGGAVSLRGEDSFADKWFGDLRALLAGKVAGVRALEVELADLDLSQALFVQKKAKVPVTGTLAGEIELALGEQPDQEAQGHVDLGIRGVQLGPGELALPLPGLTGGLSVPLVDLGDVSARLKVDQGQGKTEKIAVEGRDLQAALDASLQFARAFGTSRVQGGGHFAISPQFLEQNGKFKALLDLAGPLKKAQDKEGRYAFHLRGTLKRPGFGLGELRGGSAKPPGSRSRARDRRNDRRKKRAR